MHGPHRLFDFGCLSGAFRKDRAQKVSRTSENRTFGGWVDRICFRIQAHAVRWLNAPVPSTQHSTHTHTAHRAAAHAEAARNTKRQHGRVSPIGKPIIDAAYRRRLAEANQLLAKDPNLLNYRAAVGAYDWDRSLCAGSTPLIAAAAGPGMTVGQLMPCAAAEVHIW